MPKKAIVSKKVDLKGYGTVWFYPYDIENICSYSMYRKTTRLPMIAL